MEMTKLFGTSVLALSLGGVSLFVNGRECGTEPGEPRCGDVQIIEVYTSAASFDLNSDISPAFFTSTSAPDGFSLNSGNFFELD